MLVCAQSVTTNLRSRQLAMAAIEREFLELEGTQGGWNALFQVERGGGRVARNRSCAFRVLGYYSVYVA